MSNFKIETKVFENKGVFKALDEQGNQAGEMTFSIAGTNKIIIDHTDVKPAYAGQGVGKVMFEAAIDYARTKEIKIMPLCPFAASMFKKNETYSDVLV